MAPSEANPIVRPPCNRRASGRAKLLMNWARATHALAALTAADDGDAAATRAALFAEVRTRSRRARYVRRVVRQLGARRRLTKRTNGVGPRAAHTRED